ncbi:MAG TPA: acyl-CoA thioesterase [Saprospiraceae bacterium]|nr:acyl-CoA thioesterase [Saprospiraceae bacterium]
MEDKNISVKSPAYSETIKTEVVCPNDTNPMGILLGGRLVQWMDIAAAVCAQTHAESISVTASIDHVRFFHSAKVGDILTIKARITRAFNTSMEIMVEATVRQVGKPEVKPLSLAYFTFVAIDSNAQKRSISPVVTTTEEEEKNFILAGKRKERAFQSLDENL